MEKQKQSLFKKFTACCVSIMQRWLPDPYIFCAMLTFIVFVGAMFLTHQTAMQIIGHWSKGFWSLLAFSMQMALVLVTGHTMASSAVFTKLLSKMASKLKTPKKAIVVVTLVSTVACMLNWGFGLVIGAIFAKQVAKQLKGIDYRLLIASAYTGFLVWHGGMSGSVPLQVASEDVAKLAKQTAGAVTTNIPTSETIFSPMNLFILGALLILLPVVNAAMYPSKDQVVTVDPAVFEHEDEEVMKPKSEMTPAERIENSQIVSIILAVMGYAYIIHYFITKGFLLNLNLVNFIFLFTGILLHGTPRRFLNAFMDATKGASGILLQFPFYAGIMGIMVGTNANGESLAILMSNFFVNISTPKTFPIFTFWSAGIVNFFVPSGGGQWAVQAPIVMPAGLKIGVTTAKSAMAIAWGDAWTNMIQPFWALPALGIAGLGAKDIMGYCLIVLILSGFVISAGFLLF